MNKQHTLAYTLFAQIAIFLIWALSMYVFEVHSRKNMRVAYLMGRFGLDEISARHLATAELKDANK